MDCWGALPPIQPLPIWGAFYRGIRRTQYQRVDQEVVLRDLMPNELIMARFGTIFGHFAHPMVCAVGEQAPTLPIQQKALVGD